MSTHSEAGRPSANARDALTGADAPTAFTAADIDMDTRIAAYLASSQETIAQAEALLIRSRGVFDESGLDQTSMTSSLSSAERDQLDAIAQQDEADIMEAFAQAKAAQAFATPERKDPAGPGGTGRRPRLFI